METDHAARRRVGPAAIAATFAPAVILLALTAAASTVASVPPATFSRDPTATLGGNPLTGMQSHLGVLVWWAAAAACFLGAALLRRARRDPAATTFLVWSGSITAVLTLDDLFQFHEDLAVRYLRLDDKLVVLAYGVAVLAYLLRYRRIILHSDYALLAAGLVLFASSNAVDVVLQDRWTSDWRIFVEDGLKLLGIVSWSSYLLRTSYQLVVASFDTRARSASP
jgi:hypothetical protein